MSDKYMKEFEQEAIQFLNLCRSEEAKFLIKDYNKSNMNEYVRLGVITLVFGYRKFFLKIASIVEADINDFINGLDILNGNFELLEKWVNDFINEIRNSNLKQVAREYWTERKEDFDISGFNSQQLF